MYFLNLNLQASCCLTVVLCLMAALASIYGAAILFLFNKITALSKSETTLECRQCRRKFEEISDDEELLTERSSQEESTSSEN